jgi:hypothetical protein
MAKYPTLTYSDETGFAEQQDRMMKAPGPLRRRWSPRDGPILGADARSAQRRPPRSPRRAGAQTITNGSFVRIKGDDADAPPGLGSCRGSRPTIAVVVSRLPNMCE